MGVTDRRKREREARMELAVDAALSIYDKDGYHAITMEKIAERSELSRAALYVYFKNKEEILVSAIVSHASYFARLLGDLYDRRESIKENLLDELWVCFQRFYQKDPVTFTAWQYFHQSEMISNLSPELREVLHRSGAEVVALQHKIVQYAIAEKVFIEGDHRTLAEVIWSAFLGIIYLERTKNVLSRRNHLDVTLEMARKVLASGILNPCKESVGHGAL